jgi:hypothetical protein
MQSRERMMTAMDWADETGERPVLRNPAIPLPMCAHLLCLHGVAAEELSEETLELLAELSRRLNDQWKKLETRRPLKNPKQRDLFKTPEAGDEEPEPRSNHLSGYDVARAVMLSRGPKPGPQRWSVQYEGKTLHTQTLAEAIGKAYALAMKDLNGFWGCRVDLMESRLSRDAKPGKFRLNGAYPPCSLEELKVVAPPQPLTHFRRMVNLYNEERRQS